MNIEAHPFILSIPEERRGNIISSLKPEQLKDGAMIFEEGSESDALYLILEGSVSFTKKLEDGSIQEVSHADEGSFFGEVGVFTGEPRTLGAMAQGDAVICRVAGDDVTRVLNEAYPVRKILESVIEHLNNTTAHYMSDVIRTEKLAVVGSMVSSILHDFKNPFAAISLGAQYLQMKHPEDEQTLKICDTIEAQISRMVDMANDLSAFARGEQDINLEEVSLDAVFQEFGQLNDQLWAKDAVTVDLEANDCSLEADSGKLSRILQNLVGNAVEAIKGKTEEGKIWVHAEEAGDNIQLTIRDNGPGIPEEIREKFFEAFVTHGKRGGTGLGSAIAHSFVQAHKGSIDFETGPGGTTFTILLPKRASRS